VGEHVAIEMEAPSDVRLHLETEVGPIHFARTGVPHAVHIVPDVSSVDLSHLGPLLRRHPLFGPEGANVNVAAVEPDGGVAVRTFERGVEAETLACGTGAAAVASVLSALKGAPGPFSLRCKGGTLTVEVQGESLLLAGPAHKVFEGSIFVCCRD
jgi:diaminopimelate epimerase